MTEDRNSAKSGTNGGPKPEDEESSGKIALRLTLDKRIDLAVMVGVILYGFFLIIEAGRIRLGIIPDPLTSRGMPYLSGFFCIICGFVLAVMRLMSWSDLPGNLVPGEGHEDEEGYPSSSVRVLGILVVTWISVWLLKSLGYLLATPLFMIVAVWLMGTREWKKLILFPVLYTLVTWYIFSQPLQFVLPLGFLARFFRSLGLTP